MKILLLLLSLTAQANDRIGNGGDALVCPGKVQMFDTYLGRERYGLTIREGAPGETYEQITARWIDRLETMDLARARMFRLWASQFLNESEFVNGDLIDIPDTGVEYVPPNCHVEQAASQRSDNFPGEKRYLVSQRLWQQMSELDRAVLLIHEIAYREDLDAYSKYVRYYTSHIVSEELTSANYINLILLVGKDSFSWNEDLILVGGNSGRCRNFNLSPGQDCRQFAAKERGVPTGLLGSSSLGNRKCIYIAFALAWPPNLPLQEAQYAVRDCDGPPVPSPFKVGAETYTAMLEANDREIYYGDNYHYGDLASDLVIPSQNVACRKGETIALRPAPEKSSCVRPADIDPHIEFTIDGFLR